MHCIVLHNIVNIFLKECIWEPFPAALPLLSDLRNDEERPTTGVVKCPSCSRGKPWAGLAMVLDWCLTPKSRNLCCPNLLAVPIDKQTMAQAGIVLKVHCVRKQ